MGTSPKLDEVSAAISELVQLDGPEPLAFRDDDPLPDLTAIPLPSQEDISARLRAELRNNKLTLVLGADVRAHD